MKIQENHKQISSEKIVSIIITSLIIGLVLYHVIYWFGGQREADNAKDALVRWTQEAIVIEKTSHWWGTSCLLNADDGKRYYDENCSQYANNDKVIIMMYKEHYSWIQGLV